MRKFTCLACAGLVLLANPLWATVSEARDVTWKQTYVGTVLDTSHEAYVDGFYADIVNAEARGTFGNSDTAILTEFTPVGFGNGCASADDLRLIVVFSKAVSSFAAGDQLLLSGTSGYLCLDVVTGDFEGAAEGTVVGGTGRFKDASGDFRTTFVGRNLTVPDGLQFGFGSIRGISTGTLHVPK